MPSWGRPRVVAAERVVPAQPQAVFDVLADPAQHPRLDGSGSVRTADGGNPVRLSKGARFGMGMRLGPSRGVSYRITNVVVEFDEPRRIAWRHFAGHRWRYLLTPADGGTLVREEWDPTRVPQLWPWYVASRFPSRNERAIEASLGRLADLVPADARRDD